jgi:hypothetical protein
MNNFTNYFGKGLFYLLPMIELIFSQYVPEKQGTVKPLVMGRMEKPYNQVWVNISFLWFTYKFTIRFYETPDAV